MTEPIDPGDRPPQPARRRSSAVVIIVVLVALAAGLIAWWRWPAPVQPPVAAESPSGAPAETPPEQADASPSAGQAPGAPQHPVDAPDAAALPADVAGQLEDALAGLVGRQAMTSLLRVDDLVRRVVATVDNLPRAHAPSQAWPVAPTAGRFRVERGKDGTMTVPPDNAGRYEAFVSLAESVDAARAAALYARFYPLFQRAYAELGYPGRHFNDRLVEVIDHLLQAPEPAQPLQVTLVEVRTEGGEAGKAFARPWVRYEFADPKLEALSAGQKLMIRVGPDNARRLKARLKELRQHVADGALAARR